MLSYSMGPSLKLSVLLGCCAVFFVAIGLFVWLSPREQSAVTTIVNCEDLTYDRQVSCWLKNSISYLDNDGVAMAVQYIGDMVQSRPGECHALMHAIGEHAYHLYIKDRLFGINETVTYRTYGFYHGFITEAVLHDGNFVVAREFCSFVNEALLKSDFIDSSVECYHGFGHAVVDDHVTTPLLTAHDVADTGLRFCTELYDTFLQYINCVSGVYNGVANIYLDRSYPWPELEEDDPLRICANQPNEVQPTCYGYFARVVFQYADYDLHKALQIAQKVSPETNQYNLISNLSASLTAQTDLEIDLDEALIACRSLSASELHKQLSLIHI